MTLAPPTLAEIEAARERIRGAAVRTPLIRLPEGPGEIWLKLETLQPINSFKIRGARNALALAPSGRRWPRECTRRAPATWRRAWPGARGRWAFGARSSFPITPRPPSWRRWSGSGAASSGSHSTGGGGCSRSVASMGWTAGSFIPCPTRRSWRGTGRSGSRSWRTCQTSKTVLVPYGGGGLSCGDRRRPSGRRRPEVRVLAAEVETAAPLAASLAAGRPLTVDYRPSFVDGAGGQVDPGRDVAACEPAARRVGGRDAGGGGRGGAPAG